MLPVLVIFTMARGGAGCRRKRSASPSPHPGS